MKYLLVLLFSISAHAQNYYPIEKPNAKTVYVDQSLCEKIEQTKCWEISKCDPAVCKVSEVDDASKPIYIKENIVTCKDKDDCQIVLEKQTCDQGSALINEDYTEVYCAVLTGYEKKQDVVLDPVKAQEKADREAAELADKIAREQKENERLVSLKGCLKQTPTALEIQACFPLLVREVLKNKLALGELSVGVK
jgi:hypothetical protein